MNCMTNVCDCVCCSIGAVFLMNGLLTSKLKKVNLAEVLKNRE